MRNGRLGRALRRRLRELIALAVALILVALALSRVFAHAAPGGAHGRALGPTFTRFTPIVGVPLPVTRVLALATGQSAPRAAAQLPNGKIAVVDTDTHRLVLLDPRDHATTSVGAGQMRQPDAIVVASGALYVLDAGRGAIERYDTSGRFVREIIHNAALVGATGMAVGPGGMLYVANPRTNSIIGLSVEGTIRRQITATRGPGADQLDGPSTVAVGAGGRLYVADSANNRIEELTPSGAYVAQWPAPRSDPRHPVSLLPRPDGRVLASDPAGGLLIYLPDSGLPAFLRALHLPPGQRPPVVPTGLASLADGTVLVTDGHGKRLLVVPVPR